MNDQNTEQMGLIQQISYPLFDCKSWMKLIGVMYIIGGVLQAISIIGIIIAWLPIWIGVLLFQSASAVENAHYHGSEYELIKSLLKLKTYFIIMGVLMLIGIVFTVIIFILMIVSGTFFSSFMMHRM